MNSHPCGAPGCPGNCHWIIMRDDKKAIYKDVFRTKDAAHGIMIFENLSGYHLEHRKNDGLSKKN